MSLVLDRLSVTAPGAAAPLLPPLSAEVAGGEVLTLTGPSGIGKSRLLDAIGGHLGPGFRAGGRVILEGRDVTLLPPEQRGIGVMFQEALLFPHLSVAGNLAFALPAEVRGRAARRAAVEEALAQAGLAGLGPRDPATLSGGQRARAALVQALLARPRALLLDEPFAALDARLRGEVRARVFDHLRARAIPAVLVTHDPGDAAAAGGRVIAL